MNEFMKLAIDEARLGIHAHEGGPFGAVVVKDGKVIGKGHNQVLKQEDPTCHGEIMAIREACKNLGTHDLSGCEIYTTGEPCPMCLGAIFWANIEKIFYGCDVMDTEKIGFRDEAFYKHFASREMFCTPLDREECLKLYEEYMHLDGNVGY